MVRCCETFTTHADVSRVSKAIIRVCVCDSVCLSDFPHDKTIYCHKAYHLSRPSLNIRSKGQRSKSQSHKVKVQKVDRVAGMSYVLYSSL